MTMCTDPKEAGFSEVSLLKEPLLRQRCGPLVPVALAGAVRTPPSAGGFGPVRAVLAIVQVHLLCLTVCRSHR